MTHPPTRPRRARNDRTDLPRRSPQAPGPTGGPQHDGDTAPAAGIVELTDRGVGFVRRPENNLLASRDDVHVSGAVLHDFGLRNGTEVEGMARNAGSGRWALVDVRKACGLPPSEYRRLPQFQSLVSINPHEAFDLAAEAAETSLRVVDLVTPIGRGQRGLIVSPPRSGKTTLIEQIGQAIAKHHPETHLIVLLIDERPEEVTHFRRSMKAEILASSADSTSDAHVRLAGIAVERAKRLVEAGRHVFILLDSLTRLGRASNREQGSGGRTLSGGVDNRALQFPRQFFGAARNCEGSGSLTILATVLIDTGSRMDEVIFQEFKGTGNMELILDRELADRRIYPAVDVLRSGTRREELLCAPAELKQRQLLRRALADLSPTDAASLLISRIEKTPSNAVLLKSIAVP